jgi:hypothetical protein
LIAEYSRYEKSDPLCCPSRITHVTFDIAGNPPVVRARSASTSQTASTPGGRDQASRPFEGTYWKAVELSGKSIGTQDPMREAHLQFPGGGVSPDPMAATGWWAAISATAIA